MNKKILIIAVLSMILIGSITANSIKINNEDAEVYIEQSENEIIEIDVGDIVVDCQYDSDFAVEINTPYSLHRNINPQETEQITFKFYLNWEIKNPQLYEFEKYYFEIVLKNGGSPDSPQIDKKSRTIEGTLTDISGTLYSGEIQMGRNNFDRDKNDNDEDNEYKEPEKRKIRAVLRGIYYRGMNDEIEVDNDSSWVVTGIDLLNEGPDSPTILYSEDIRNEGKGNLENEYTFYAKGATDPDGDDISYYNFDFHDGTIDTVYNNGDNYSASHTWESEGIKTVTVRAYDRFYKMGEGIEMKFTLPRSKDISLINNYKILSRFPALSYLLDKIL